MIKAPQFARRWLAFPSVHRVLPGQASGQAPNHPILQAEDTVRDSHLTDRLTHTSRVFIHEHAVSSVCSGQILQAAQARGD